MIKRLVTAALLLPPVAAFTACATDEASDQATETSPTTTTAAPDSEQISTELRNAEGQPVANATIDFTDGFATVTVETVEGGILSPGFHGLHIHEAGLCEPNSAPPGGGESGNFLSAGGHFQAPGSSGNPASGDLTAFQVRSDGSARLVTTTDAFTEEDLRGGQGTALMIHEGEDNFANIPDRYAPFGGPPGPDQDTLDTGDAGARVACGVLAQGTEPPPETTTVPPETVTETETSPTTTTTTSPSPSPTETETTTTGTETTSPTTTSPTESPTESPTPTTTAPPPPG